MQTLAARAAPTPMRYLPARLRAALWRFRTLPYAERTFAGAPRPCVLERPFFGYRLHVDISRSSAQRLLYLEGERFMAERFLLRRLLRPGFRVADVGANIGYYLLFMARHLGPAGSIACFEPEPENLIELGRNIERNRLGNVRVFPLALGDADAETTLHPGINGRVAADGSGSLQVSLRRLDSVLTGPLDLIKIDVEGHEGQVLAGAERLIDEQRPLLFIEIHPALLTPPASLAGILDWLAARYRHMAAYAPPAGRRSLRTLAARYLPVDGTSRVLIAARRTGVDREPFWVVCSPRPLGLETRCGS